MNTDISVRKMTPENLPAVARCHRAAYGRDHFTSTLSQRMLEEFYRTLTSDHQYDFVAIDRGGELCGFVVAGQSGAFAVKRFIRSHLHRLSIALILHPHFILEKLKIPCRLVMKLVRRRSRKPSKGHTPRRAVGLESIAVLPGRQGGGIASMLIDQLEADLRKNAITTYRLSVKKNNAKAIIFYEHRGFTRSYQSAEELHYVKHLTPEEGYHHQHR
jgi:ribosomal protein S18 acetylase RimI-like enzyme